jgi:CRP-like cAMP-binding protein
MGRDDEAARVFRVLLLDAKPAERSCAVEALQAAARVTVWRRDQSCGPSIAQGCIGCLLTGVARKYSVRPDGHRQIVDILIAGDFLGLVPCNDSFLVEAVSDDTRIASFRPDQMTRLVSDYPVIARMLHARLAAALRRLEDHLLVQSRITAIDKVGGYLMLLRDRTPQSTADGLNLPISRYDIADHLGLAVETVSRAMSSLRRYGVISMTGPRQLVFHAPADRAAIWGETRYAADATCRADVLR